MTLILLSDAPIVDTLARLRLLEQTYLKQPKVCTLAIRDAPTITVEGICFFMQID